MKDGPFPTEWVGPQKGITLSWRTNGVSVTGSDATIANKADVEAFLRAVGAPLGRVMVTPELGVVITWGKTSADGKRSPNVWGRVDVEIVGAENAPLADIIPLPVRDKSAVNGGGPTEPVHPPVRPEEVAKVVESEVGGWWYELVQQACIAWVDGDDVTFDAAMILLEPRRGRARIGRALLEALSDPPAEVPLQPEGPVVPLAASFQGDPFRMGHTAKAIVGGAAAAAERSDVVRQIATEFERVGSSKGKISLLGVANALRILAGDTRKVIVVDRNDD